MGYLILCICCSTAILTVFKIASRCRQDIFRIILINYLVASLSAFLIYLPAHHDFQQVIQVFPWALVIGIIFIALFFLVGRTTLVSGMTVTSIATKMSVVIPVLFSMWVYQESSGVLKLGGIGLAIIALFLSVFRKHRIKGGYLLWFLPLLLFFGNGFLDSVLKFTQAEKLIDFDVYLFNAMVFGVALFAGVLIWPFRRKSMPASLDWRTILLGSILGLANFGSLFGMVMALRSHIDSSMVFVINNTGVVVFSTIIGIAVFKERLSVINLIGIFLAIVSIVMLSLQI